MDEDTLRVSSRPEWPLLLFNLFYLHGALRLRARLGRGGWNEPQHFLGVPSSAALVCTPTLCGFCLL